MGKSWMKLLRSSREHIRGVMAFVKFAREHSKRKLVVVCSCKKLCAHVRSVCWANQRSSEVVFAHLTPGAIIIEGYTEWIMHGESLVSPVDNEIISEAPKMVQVDSITLHKESSGMQVGV
jgi:hypothetical protein